MGRHAHERSQIADTAVPLRSQMLVRMNAATAGGETRLLADGNQVPVLGLGVWQVHDGPECVNAVRWALEAGYRHIDTSVRRRLSSGTERLSR